MMSGTLTKMRNTWKNNRKIIPVFLIIFIIYLAYAYAVVIQHTVFYRSIYAYYNYFIDALLHGRLDVYSPSHHDLSFFNGKWYLYWGPAPGLIILPFYLLQGVQAYDVVYTLLFGLINIFLFYFVSEEFQKYFRIRLAFVNKVILLVCFAVISPNMYLSLKGGIWATNQIAGVLYLLIGYLFFARFLNNPKRIHAIAISFIFFNLAWLSRFTLVFNMLLFLYPLSILYTNKRYRMLLKALVVMTVIFGTFATLFLTYNVLRFHNPFEVGMRFQRGDVLTESLFLQYGNMSPKYILFNSFFYFFNHIKFMRQFPFINPDSSGNSLVSVYPPMLFVFFLFPGRYRKRGSTLFIILACMVIFITMEMLLMNVGPGWVQFGIRYLLDIAPLTYLLLIFVLPRINGLIKWPVFIYGTLINLAGVLIYYYHIK